MLETEQKLIILTGSPGMGKSTLSQRYIDEHPMALNLDIDKVWWMLGQWQESRPASSEQKMRLAYVMADTHLLYGYDVIVAQHMDSLEPYRQFERIADKHAAKLIEIVLFNSEDEAVDRCVERGKRSGYKTGFRPGGILESEGGEAKIRKMYQEVIRLARSRPSTVWLRPVIDEVDQTYREFLKAVNCQS